MSTITSPRLSTTSLTTPSSSRRTSLDTSPARAGPTANTNTNTSTHNAPGPTPHPQHRRGNRIALRDYYNLRNPSTLTTLTTAPPSSQPSSTTTTSQPPSPTTPPSELDTPNFNASKYVTSLLATQDLTQIVNLESSLINQIRGLDGERKALVYDNYSRLIAATETIWRMKEGMGMGGKGGNSEGEGEAEGEGQGGMLRVAVQHILDVVGGLAVGRDGNGDGDGDSHGDDRERKGEERAERETVKWVLDAPRRLEGLIGAGDVDGAMTDWNEIRELLGAWEGVEGVDEVREKCEVVMMKQMGGHSNGR